MQKHTVSSSLLKQEQVFTLASSCQSILHHSHTRIMPRTWPTQLLARQFLDSSGWLLASVELLKLCQASLLTWPVQMAHCSRSGACFVYRKLKATLQYRGCVCIRNVINMQSNCFGMIKSLLQDLQNAFELTRSPNNSQAILMQHNIQ